MVKQKKKISIKDRKTGEKENEKIDIPKYILDGNQNIPEDLKKVLDYFRDCGNKNYQVCLVGEKESVTKDLKERDYQGKNFIHLDNKSLNDDYPFLPISVKNSIRRINRLISNPDNEFNKTILGIHTLGLVPISEIESLNALGYGSTSWDGIKVYDNKCNKKQAGWDKVTHIGNVYERYYYCPPDADGAEESEWYKCTEQLGNEKDWGDGKDYNTWQGDDEATCFKNAGCETRCDAEGSDKKELSGGGE